MKMSESIAAISAALVKAQSQIEDAVKDSANSHFKNKYADLTSVRAAIRKPLADNGLCVVQGPRRAEGGVEVETMILHTSGEWISEAVFIPVNKWDAHGTGSAITYGRRYGLMSLLCVGTDDDDGNASGTRNEKLFNDGLIKALGGIDELKAWFRSLPENDRNQLSEKDRVELKKAAASVAKKTEAAE